MAEDKAVERKRTWDGRVPDHPRNVPEESITTATPEYGDPHVIPGKEAD